MAEYDYQHVVSSVLLKQFSLGGKKRAPLLCYDLRSGSELKDHVTPETAGGVPNYIKLDPKELEHLWQKIEKKFDAAINNLDRGECRAEDIQTFKEMIALHWARSISLKELHDKLIPLEQKRSRLRLEEKGAHREVVEGISKHIKGEFDRGNIFKDEVEKNYYLAQERINTLNLDFGEAIDLEFLVGDNPVLTLQKGNSKAGPLSDIPWDSANTVIMPLSRRFMAALTTKEPRFIKLDRRSVNNCNYKQVVGAINGVYYHPKSKLAQFVAMASKDWEPVKQVIQSLDLPDNNIDL